MIIKKIPQSPFNQSTKAPEDAANVVLPAVPIEASNEERELIELTKKYSMNGSLRIWTLITALKKILENNIEGDFVETGVWKGGNLILIKKYIYKFYKWFQCFHRRNWSWKIYYY